MRVFRTASALLALACSADALPEASSLDEALDMARQRDCSIYMELTGSDWCAACINLRSNVLDSPEFDQAMDGKLILFAVDYPRAPELVAKLTPEQREERKALLASYEIEGLPGAILLDEKGLPFDVIRGARPATADYLPLVQAALNRRAARDAALAEAAGLQGLERAKSLIKALEALPETCRIKYTDITAEIHALDPENTLHFRDIAREKKLCGEQIARLHRLTEEFAGKFSPDEIKESLRMLDSYLDDPGLMPQARQMALRAKGDAYGFLSDFDSMRSLYKAAVEAAPDTRLARRLKKDLSYYEEQGKPSPEQRQKPLP